MQELQIRDEVLPAARGELATSQTTKAQAQVQALVAIAKRFPRDEMMAYNKIMKACQRLSLAKSALYSYPRGGQTVTGPSIRLAEVLANSWGNICSGVEEVTQDGGESKMVAYCWDVETNVKDERVFIAKHERDTKKGKQFLTDSRDIYELTANLAARRKRACILAIIPQDIVDAAVDACHKTLEKGDGRPLEDRVREMVKAFADIGVNIEMIEKRLGHYLAVTTANELVTLHKVYTSISQGMAGREQFFDMPGGASADAPKSEGAAALNATLAKAPNSNPEPEKSSEVSLPPDVAAQAPASKPAPEAAPPGPMAGVRARVKSS